MLRRRTCRTGWLSAPSSHRELSQAPGKRPPLPCRAEQRTRRQCPRKGCPQAGRDATDAKPDPKIDDPASRRLVLGVGTMRENRQSQCKDTVCITGEAIQDCSCRSALARARAHQLSPERILRRGTRTDVDFISPQVIESLKHQPKGFCKKRIAARVLLKDVGLEHRHGASDRGHRWRQGTDLRRQKLAATIQFVHDVAHNRRVKFCPAEGKKLCVRFPDTHNLTDRAAALFSGLESRARVSMAEQFTTLPVRAERRAETGISMPSIIDSGSLGSSGSVLSQR